MSKEKGLIDQIDPTHIKTESPLPTAESVPESPTGKQLVKDKYFIGTWDEADLFLRDNEYIKTGYRINFNTLKRIFLSLFMCHNESTNIWSHLCGAIFFAILIVYIVFRIIPDDALKGINWSVVSGYNNTHINSTFFLVISHNV